MGDRETLMELATNALNVRYGKGSRSLGQAAQKDLDEALHLVILLEEGLDDKGKFSTDSLRGKSLASIREILKPYRVRQ